MTKKNRIARNKAISEILLVASNEYTTNLLEEKTKEICKKYFPNYDIFLENALLDFAYSLQNINLEREVINIEINRYERKKKL